MDANKWILHKAGLINFWYYDDEEFHFSEGRLLLRGSNGSGKSVTMQSFIPLLLDGNRSPERLDPFGSKARKMENYLLGEESEKEENTAYLYIEFKKQQKQEKESQRDRKKSAERQLDAQIKTLEGQQDEFSEKIEHHLDEMDSLSEDFSFDEQSFMREELIKEQKKEYSFSYIKNSLSKQTDLVEKAYKALEKENAKNQEYDRVLKQLDAAKEARNNKEKEMEQSNLLLLETKEEMVERVYTWKKANIELLLPEETLVQVSRSIQNFTPDSSFDDVLSHVRQQAALAEGALYRKISHLQASREAGVDEQKRILEEISEWKNRKEPEPAREEKILRNRSRLEAEGVPFLPLYRAVDFHNDISDELKGKIEESLVEMGLIDALIIPAAHRQKALETVPDMADKILFPSPNFLSHNLSAYVDVEKTLASGITFEEVDNVLKSILVDPGSSSTFLNEKGEYGIGILHGKVSGTYLPKYIGTSARKRFREEMVQKLQNQLEELGNRMKQLDEEINALNGRTDKLKEELKGFPDRKDLVTAANQVKEARFNHDRSVEEVNLREKEERQIYGELKTLQQEAFEYTGKLGLKADLEIYEDALQAAKSYKDHLYELEREHSRLLQNVENMLRLLDSKEALLEDLDHILRDLTAIRRKTNETEASYQSSMEQLKLSNYEQIKNEIDNCIRMLNEIPLEIQKETRRSEREKANCAQLDAQLITLVDRLTMAHRLLDIYREAFKEECSLGYVVPAESEASLLDTARRLCKELPLGEKLQKEDLIKALYERFQENTPYLREYSVRIDTLFEKQSEAGEEYITSVLQHMKRLHITGKVRGKEIDFYSLLEYIREGMEENEKLLKESDRQLFEDILVKNISKKIRAKIYHSEQWVKKMNQLMESMNTSSGLSFSLKWSSRKAETEEQLDTAELVQLLMQEGTLMKESDLNKLSEHFRSKIAQARRIQEDTGKNQTFHTIMREILDYRKWFEFKLFYVKTGQNKKELTNNAFYQFSGGEKAMAMYVPLFSAVYARYQGARRDCPRIISLDEAFAGVDEKNIRDMFRLLNELGLDFVINSQILWGDYDTVPSLSICELIRPDNADFVTVIRYHWNGVVKQLVS